MKNKRSKLWLNLFGACCLSMPTMAEEMDKMWGESMVKLRADAAGRGQLFADGNYAMFIHWGIYSNLANKVDGKTYYGIGEWIMNPRMANIPAPKYMTLAKDFNPVKFEAEKIAQLAKDAGMKYIIITSKHHDGFAMYGSKSNSFNILDATPFGRDPMKELADACKKVGVGFGFYYSHNQDWTFPGGNGGPGKDAEGNPADFDDYFVKKCLPQVKEITSEYGQIEIVWFDTPGDMPKKYVEELVEVVRENQPNAMISGRAGHGLGDYQSLGDMHVPIHNVEGLWETVDTTNDSWAFAWYDENWKTPKTILDRVVATVARGGTYMLNVGLRGDGSIPERAAEPLREAGAWIRRYPQVIYGADASPWQHALPWGDVTVMDDRMFLAVFDWPRSGKLHLPGLKNEIKSVTLLEPEGAGKALTQSRSGSWTCISVPSDAPDPLVSIIEVQLDGKPDVDSTFGLDPEVRTLIQADFSKPEGVELKEKKWMEKFGEWKHIKQISGWSEGTYTEWEVDVLEPGAYQVDLTYAGEGRLVWGVSVVGGESIENQQNSSHNYQSFPIGWLEFPESGRYKVRASCLDGEVDSASLSAIGFKRVR